MRHKVDLLIVGGGMATGRLLQRLCEMNYENSIAVICSEEQVGYNRVLLPGYLAGAYRVEDLEVEDRWSGLAQLTLWRSCTVTELNFGTQTAVLDNGQHQLEYAQLVLATGSTVPVPQIPGVGLDNVLPLRSLVDAKCIQSITTRAQDVVVVGGGLLGLEAADALNQLGLQVCVVHRSAQLMGRQLDEQAAGQLAHQLEQDGVQILLNRQLQRIFGETSAEAVELDDGSHLPAQIVLFATGTTANSQLAETAGLDCAGGIVADEFLRASEPNVFALGECAKVAGQRQGLVEGTNAQADALAYTLVGKPTPVTLPPHSTRLKVSSVAVFSAGTTKSNLGDADDLVIKDPQQGIYRRLIFNGRKLVGAVLFGDLCASREIARRIGTDVVGLDKDRLAFGVN